MRLLNVLFLSLLHLLGASGIHAPFMGKSAAVTKEVALDQLRSCSGTKLKADNGTNQKGVEYAISCRVANSFFLTAAELDMTGSHGDSETSGCYLCQNEGNDQICKDANMVQFVSKKLTNITMLTETASCALEAGLVNNPKLKLRYARTDGLKGAENNNFHVKTITNFIQPESDIVSSHSQSFYADTFNWKNHDHFKCRGCLGGAYLQFQGTQNQRFNIELFPRKTCEWIIFCFDFVFDGKNPSKCIRNTEVYLFLHNGIVHSGNRQSAFAMNLLYGRSIRIERTVESADHFWITSGQNERLVLAPFNTGAKIMMAMSHNDCLELPIQGMGTLGSPELVNPTPVDKDRANPRGVTPVKKEDVDEDNNKHQEVTVKPLGKADEVQALSEPSTTTEKVLNMTMAPTTEVPTQAPNMQGIAAPKYDENSGNARYRGWLTWAYFYGSLTGTLLGSLICGLLFFLIRRTVYRAWYRGMYKRYGCDASGTTGGVTRAEFGATTTGGNTTIGSTTAEATTATTMVETTGGTTSDGTTTGGNTGTKSMITI